MVAYLLQGDFMKRFLLFLFVCIMFLTSETILAQTASDYYLPLVVNNYASLHTQSIPPNSTWGFETLTYTIEGTDLISGQQYYREKCLEEWGAGLSKISIVFWLRKDSVGNLVIGAMSEVSTDIDSATIVSGNLFPNEFLTKGYYRISTQGRQTWQDSVLSVTETVNVPAGTYNNCLKISDTHFDSTGTAVYREYHYYAYGVGLVKAERTIPVIDAHTDGLIGYGTTGVGDVEANTTPRNYLLSQNYPNPFNPSTTINYSLAKEGNVKLTVYNVIGNKVATLLNEYKPVGSYSVQFDGSNLSSGIYLYRLESGNYSAAKKIILMK